MQVNKLKEDCKKVCINVFKSTSHPYGNDSDSPTKLESVPGTNQYLVMTVEFIFLGSNRGIKLRPTDTLPITSLTT